MNTQRAILATIFLTYPACMNRERTETFFHTYIHQVSSLCQFTVALINVKLNEEYKRTRYLMFCIIQRVCNMLSRIQIYKFMHIIILAIVRNSDIHTPICVHTMSQWQREQVHKYCTMHGRDELALTLPRSTRSEIFQRKNLFRHLIFDDKRKLIFCFIPKVQSHTILLIVSNSYSIVYACMQLIISHLE